MKETEEFCNWVKENAEKLRNMASREAADVIGERLLKIDNRLGIEIERADESKRRAAIITAFSDPEVFLLVHQIVNGLKDASGWIFWALKPPRGFDFNLTVGKEKINAKDLTFEPIEDIIGGIRLIVLGEPPAGKQAEEIAWLIVETGIGEELAGRIQHLEFGPPGKVKIQQPITTLGEYVKAELRIR